MSLWLTLKRRVSCITTLFHADILHLRVHQNVGFTTINVNVFLGSLIQTVFVSYLISCRSRMRGKTIWKTYELWQSYGRSYILMKKYIC